MEKVVLSNPDHGTYSFRCLGCNTTHHFMTSTPDRPCWNFNGDVEKPTVNPSLLVRWSDSKGPRVCHLFIKEGKIQYLADCTHALAGKTFDMVDMPYESKET